jgi:hypothetical protein
MNLYSYVGGNPTKYIDPLGLAATTPFNLVWHYFWGGGANYFLDPSEISGELASVDITTFPGFKQILTQNKGKYETVSYTGNKVISSQGLFNSIGLGQFTIMASGKITINCCDWSFPDLYRCMICIISTNQHIEAGSTS